MRFVERIPMTAILALWILIAVIAIVCVAPDAFGAPPKAPPVKAPPVTPVVVVPPAASVPGYRPLRFDAALGQWVYVADEAGLMGIGPATPTYSCGPQGCPVPQGSGRIFRR